MPNMQQQRKPIFRVRNSYANLQLENLLSKKLHLKKVKKSRDLFSKTTTSQVDILSKHAWQDTMQGNGSSKNTLKNLVSEYILEAKKDNTLFSQNNRRRSNNNNSDFSHMISASQTSMKKYRNSLSKVKNAAFES